VFLLHMVDRCQQLTRFGCGDKNDIDLSPVNHRSRERWMTVTRHWRQPHVKSTRSASVTRRLRATRHVTYRVYAYKFINVKFSRDSRPSVCGVAQW